MIAWKPRDYVGVGEGGLIVVFSCGGEMKKAPGRLRLWGGGGEKGQGVE